MLSARAHTNVHVTLSKCVLSYQTIIAHTESSILNRALNLALIMTENLIVLYYNIEINLLMELQ